MNTQKGAPLLTIVVTVGLGVFCYMRYHEGSRSHTSHPSTQVAHKIQSLLDLTAQEVDEEEKLYQVGEYRTEDFSHILVLPDVHGDHLGMMYALWAGVLGVVGDANILSVSRQHFKQLLMDAAEQGLYPDIPLFPESNVVLVSMGDIVDRGPQSVLCLRLLWSIEEVIGWKVVSLYGNHEIMAVLGDHNFVHEQEINDFGSSRNRRKAFDFESPIWQRLVASSMLVARFSDSNKKGIVFSHAGIESSWISWADKSGFGTTVAEWNKHAHSLMTSGIKISRNLKETDFAHMFLRTDTPLWTRKFGGERTMEMDICKEEIDSVLKHLDVDRMIVGHTIQWSKDARMNHDCDERLFRTDVALSKYISYQKAENIMRLQSGQPSMLVINVPEGAVEFDSIAAVYYNVKTKELTVDELIGAYSNSEPLPGPE